ncbi:MAG: protein translocase subunit SecD, partial [Lentisphaeria bacterium]|nr:protein translocase subunit SecD [Lentisphaeria bacterium]
VIVKSQKITTNRDVISVIRKNSAGSIRLGIDLDGGAEFMLALVPEKADKEKIQKNFDQYRDIAIETLRKRLTGKNIYEADIAPAGREYISMRVPLATKEEKVVIENLIKLSAKLQFRLVHPESERELQGYYANPRTYTPPEGYEVLKAQEVRDGKMVEEVYLVEREAQMDGKEIDNAYAAMDQYGQREILLSFKHKGAVQFGEVTTRNVGRRLGIVLDGQLYSAPVIKQPITGGNAQISGNFSREDAENISNALVSGSVPFSMEIQAQSDIDPLIGKATIRDGIYSGIAGLIVVMLFMIAYYLKSGIIAVLSLALNGVLMLGAIAAFDVTLTLPGIAEIILTFGMAVDANVLIYERIREEVNSGKTLQNAVDLGFDRAYSAIFDSNLTTLFVSMVLLWQGTGAIKGFAVTLAIGVFTTMFTAVFLTRLLFDLMMRFFHITSLKMCAFIKQPHFDFLGKRWYAVGFSVLFILASVVTVCVRGRDCLSIDFTGGTQLVYSYAKAVPAEKLHAFLAGKGFENKITYKAGGAAGDEREVEILIRNKKQSETAEQGTAISDAVTKAVKEAYPESKFVFKSQSTLGALIGETFLKISVISLVLSFLVMILYMTLRFQFAYSIAGNIVLLHDVIMSVGLYLMLGGQITMNVVAASLTIIGISINDTIVTYDRVRENLKLTKTGSCTYWELINLSVNQTLSRTILTSITTMMVLVMQLIFGGTGIRDFVSVMLFGMIFGTYSSIFLTNIIIAYWHKPTQLELEGGSVKKEAASV